MGNMISEFKAELAERHTRLLSHTPPNEDGGRPHCHAPTDIVRDESAFRELINLCEDMRDALGGEGIDDRHLLLEKVLTWMATHSELDVEHRLESMVVEFLYKDLPHPPESYLSLPNEATHVPRSDVNYAFRPADGSNYNVMTPALGKAGTPYARSVPSARSLPASALPDASLVFDMLLKRDEFVPHPDGVSSLFFAFADLVIHSIFNTDRNDSTINNSSSYLDLSPLYGSSDKQVDTVRRKDGTGRLKEDVFADSRLLFMPPSACALLVLLCRNHNYIADKMLAINEHGKFHAPETLEAPGRLAQDDELFARARLVNCGFFMQIILGDYVGAILGLARDGHAWRLKILEPYRSPTGGVVPRGEGNAVSAEFNLMYRWHATLSAPDTAWIEQEFRALFPGRDLATLTKEDFGRAYGHIRSRSAKEPQEWTFGGLKRGESGRYQDVELAQILQNATEAEAGAFRARGIPEVMKVVELMAIEQARSWGTCSLNEFRRFMGLKPYASFSEWNSDESVARAAQMLYHDIDNLELYVGLEAEEAKKPGPGAGLCPGYTLSRAILSDAVCLTRGDRFMTTDFTPQNLTAWGYNDCQFDVNDGSYGGMLTKLLFRTLPDCYPAGSVYAHFPFLVPKRMRKEFLSRDAALLDQYTWDRPVLPTSLLELPRPPPAYEARVRALTGRPATAFTGLEQVLFTPDALEAHRLSFLRFTDAQLHHQSLSIGGSKRYVDIVRDVVNMVPIFWIAAMIRPDATEAHDEGKHYRPDRYFQGFADLADYVYVNTDPSREFALRQRAQAVAASISKHVVGDAASLGMFDLISRIARRLQSALHTLEGSPLSPDGFVAQPPCAVPDVASFLPTLRLCGNSQGLASAFVGDLAASAAVLARCVARLVDRLLDGETHLRNELALAGLGVTDKQIAEQVYEAVRGMDDVGVEHGLMDKRFIEATVPAMLHCIFSLPNLQRAPGPSGKLHRVVEGHDGAIVEVASYQNWKGEVTPWPSSLAVEYSELLRL